MPLLGAVENDHIDPAPVGPSYGGGPARSNRITGETSFPGGVSGVLGSPFYANVLTDWLTKETRRHVVKLGEIRIDAVSHAGLWLAGPQPRTRLAWVLAATAGAAADRTRSSRRHRAHTGPKGTARSADLP